ncbi:hypothetical protein SSCG_03565 [Streptomyces clavuligerus]|nr:hypothetical protein SSCG_03565 [Streptomyces clavuligerus]
MTRSGEQGRVRAGVPGRRVSFARGAVDRLLLLDRVRGWVEETKGCTG